MKDSGEPVPAWNSGFRDAPSSGAGRPTSRSGPPGRKPSWIPYWLRLAVMAVTLAVATGVFVLVVLPQRFVLQSGLRSSGVSFPTSAMPAEPGDLVMVDPRPLPPPAAVPEDVEDEAVDVPAAPPEPGPAERFWADVLPLLETEDWTAALPLFREYLAEHPEDGSVRLEYGIALARAGELEAAEVAFRNELGGDEDWRARIELAGLLRDQARWDEAVARFQELSDERPDDHAIRVELARVLWAAGRPEASMEVAAAVPEDAVERGDAEELIQLVAASLAPEEEPLDPDPQLDRLELARLAVESGELDRARGLYAEAVAETPDAPAVFLDWADLFQYLAEDYETALEALERRARLEPPSTEDRLRLARLYAWTDRGDAATAELTALLGDQVDLAEGWALLGDVRRWGGARVSAAEAYARALELDPEEPQAVVGMEALRAATDAAIAGRQEVGVGPVLSYFRDSEGYRRLSLTARAALVHDRRTGVTLSSGFQRLEGLRLDGVHAVEEGPFAELEVARWWREGTVRAAISAGVDRLDTHGAEPLFGVRFEASDPARGGIDVEFRHGRAYPLVTTLESVDLEIRADNLQVAWHLMLPRDWVLTGSTEGGLFRGDDADNRRVAAGLGLYRELTPALQVGTTTRVLHYTGAAPVDTGRRAYWDPELFWSTEVPVEIRVPRERGWSARLRASPGVGLVRERFGNGSEWVPQVMGSGGIRYLGDRTTLDADLFHARGREGEYHSLGLNLRLTVRR